MSATFVYLREFLEHLTTLKYLSCTKMVIVKFLPSPFQALESSWIPFGSSVIIGPSDPNAVHPYAAISRVDINVAELKMTVHHQNGSQAVIMLMTNRSSTVLKVTNITYAGNASLPFATLRSMWVL